MNKLLMGTCLTMAMQVGHSQTLPQLGKDPIEKIVAAMTCLLYTSPSPRDCS